MRVYKTLTRISVAFSLKLKHKIAHNSRSFGLFSTLIHSEPTPLSFPLTSTYSSPLFDLSHITKHTSPLAYPLSHGSHPKSHIPYSLRLSLLPMSYKLSAVSCFAHPLHRHALFKIVLYAFFVELLASYLI